MAAYVLALLNIDDPSFVESYAPPTQALVEKHGGRYIARDRASAQVEGDGGPPSVAVLIEFPTLAQAKAFYGDPDYAPLIEMRKNASSGDVLIFDGET